MELVVFIIIGVMFLIVYGLFILIAQNLRHQMPNFKEDPNVIWRQLGQSSPVPKSTGSFETLFGDVATTTTPKSKPVTYPDPTTTSKRSGHPIGCGQTVGRIILGIILGTGGLATAGFGYITYSEYTDSENWPTALGTVINNNIRESYDSEDDEYSYYPEVRYEYVVDGQRYTSDRLNFKFFEKSYSSRPDAQTFLASYRLGSRINVLYNPNEPERAVLVREYDSALGWGLIGGGIVGLCIGVALILFSVIRGFGGILAPQSQTV